MSQEITIDCELKNLESSRTNLATLYAKPSISIILLRQARLARQRCLKYFNLIVIRECLFGLNWIGGLFLTLNLNKPLTCDTRLSKHGHLYNAVRTVTTVLYIVQYCTLLRWISTPHPSSIIMIPPALLPLHLFETSFSSLIRDPRSDSLVVLSRWLPVGRSVAVPHITFFKLRSNQSNLYFRYYAQQY